MNEGTAVMNLHPMGQPSETIIAADDQKSYALRHITLEQLLHLGTRQVVYMRTGMRDGEQAFVLYRADGTPLVVVDDVATAMEVAATHGLGFVTVH
jgi:hypothetical protein